MTMTESAGCLLIRKVFVIQQLSIFLRSLKEVRYEKVTPTWSPPVGRTPQQKRGRPLLGHLASRSLILPRRCRSWVRIQAERRTPPPARTFSGPCNPDKNGCVKRSASFDVLILFFICFLWTLFDLPKLRFSHITYNHPMVNIGWFFPRCHKSASYNFKEQLSF